ncbi:UDP-glycosyltransferase 87A1 [Triticum urartu]|uniref:UDP-glycosyltransferase 87A1 n=1 Tax=Triticum urartu TaxID=4572 RepID=M8AL87_TRIUA|nr:UDP-glycosyltransferase 87A1 [Triticum urartu]
MLAVCRLLVAAGGAPPGTVPATFFLALYHLDLWSSGDEHERDEELSTKSMDQYVSCLSSVRMSDLMVFSRWKRHMKITAEAFVKVRKAQCLLLTSFHELEPRAINTTAELLPFPVYPIGPVHMQPDGNTGRIQDEEHRDWLDAQPEKSVMYVSFGSYASMPHSQFQEIAMGLLDAGVKFFWMARDKAPELREKCGDKGLAVPWCDQQEVGIDLREQRGEDGSVSRAAISDAARKLMDSDSAVGQEMRKRAAQLREVSRSAVREGGSSHRSFSGFLEDLAEGSCAGWVSRAHVGEPSDAPDSSDCAGSSPTRCHYENRRDVCNDARREVLRLWIPHGVAGVGGREHGESPATGGGRTCVYRACLFFINMTFFCKRAAGRTVGENEGEEVVAQTTRSNVGRKHGQTDEGPVWGGRAGKRATNSAPRDEGGRHPKRAKKVKHMIGSSGPPPRNRASPSRLFVLNSGLEDIQKDAIGDISFGGVLDIGTRTIKALFG